MPRLDYVSPPVHEVILDLQFGRMWSSEELDSGAELLKGVFAEASRSQAVSVTTEFSPLFSPTFRSEASPGGWIFRRADPTTLFRLGSKNLTLHFVRSPSWPEGPYVGWGEISSAFHDLVRRLSPMLREQTVRRAGLRYLNRIAVPRSGHPSRWLTLIPEDPPGLRDLFSFDFRKTWARVAGHQDLGATVRAAQIEVGKGVGESGDIGMLLDIDVFNHQVKHAPRLGRLEDWFERAHGVENDIFETCVTSDLRARF